MTRTHRTKVQLFGHILVPHDWPSGTPVVVVDMTDTPPGENVQLVWLNWQTGVVEVLAEAPDA